LAPLWPPNAAKLSLLQPEQKRDKLNSPQTTNLRSPGSAPATTKEK
jgi:hypothetical protein